MEKKQRRYKNYRKPNNDSLPFVEEETVKEEVVEALQLKATLKDCARLNVRKAPNAKSQVIHIVDSKSIIEVLPEESTNEWYKTFVRVKGEDIIGYCMKKFISVD